MVLLIPAVTCAQSDSLRLLVGRLAASVPARVGVAIARIENGDTVTLNGAGRYPMQSVFKFPLALAVLRRVDEGTFSLDQKIRVRSTDLLPNTWSPLRDKFPGGNVVLPLSEILRYTVSQSDNNGCDILFRLMGGTGAVNDFIHSLGIDGIAIVANEEEMHRDWNVQFGNFSTPAAMAQLLRKFYRGEVLGEKSTAFLRRIMEETTTGPKRLKGLLPKDAIVAHKTGSSGANDTGITAALNDAGVMTLPDGSHLAIAVFVSDASCDDETGEQVIAQIARTVWDSFVARK